MTSTTSQGLERLTTGVPRLDSVLHGGIPRYSVVFVAGLPGSGKTILSEQMLFANAREGHTCLYLSTISEPPIKVLRFLQQFSFFDADRFGSSVIYVDIGSTLRSGGPEAVLAQISDLLRTHRPALVVVDSFKVLQEAFSDQLQFREFTSDLTVNLSLWEATTLFVGEYTLESLVKGPEFAIADGIIYLYGTEEAEKQKRFLRVMKMRGASVFAGEHVFRISGDGIEVFPRMNPEVMGEYAFPGTRAGSAIDGLDEMLAGGVFDSTTTVISGGTGSGKTLVALSFLVDGARKGQPGLLVSFEESAQQLVRNCHAFGWEAQELLDRGLLDILHVSPSELDLDVHTYVIKERAEAMGARRIMIDSITAFETVMSGSDRYRSYLWAIADYFKRSGVTVFFTTETSGLFEPLEISRSDLSFLGDNVIFLRYVENDLEIHRALGVLKMRGSSHDRHIRPLTIEPPRISVGSVAPLLGTEAARPACDA